MAVVRCSKGHYYDDEKFARCPHCGVLEDLQEGEQKAAHAPREGITIPLFRRKSRGTPQEDKKTVAIQADIGHAGDDQKTIGFFDSAKGNDFVTGWLVCVKGPEKGRDYRLFHGFNRIGRGVDAGVYIASDSQISKEGHCSIVYDDRSNRFSIVPEGGNSTYVRGQLLTVPETLTTGDIIQMGESSFEFVAFCREGRVWERES